MRPQSGGMARTIRPLHLPSQSRNRKNIPIKNDLPASKKENGGGIPALRRFPARRKPGSYSSRPPPGISRGNRIRPAMNTTAVRISPAHMLWLRPTTRWPMPAQNITNKA